MNNVSISGRLVYEPKLTETENYKVLPMRLAVSRNDKKKTTDFINAKAWGSAAEFISKYFHKGDPIEIAGRIQTDSFERQDGTKATETYVFVLDCGFVLSKKTDGAATEPRPMEETQDGAQLPFEI